MNVPVSAAQAQKMTAQTGGACKNGPLLRRRNKSVFAADKEVSAVPRSGKVTAKGAGKTIITVKTKEGKLTDTITVEVVDKK